MLLSILLSIGAVIIVVVLRAVWWVSREVKTPSFPAAGFVYRRSGSHLGWVSRDGSNDDWILWSVADQCMYRATSLEPSKWMASDETRAECLHLGRLYVEAKGKPKTHDR